MIRRLRLRQPGAPLHRICWWYFCWSLCYVWFLVFYRFRIWGARNIPGEGAVMLVSNHQSFFDPIIVGLGSSHRQFYALARATLFDNPVFAWHIRSLNAIPVNQDSADTKAMRACIDVLKKHHALLIFPEGSRTLDGAVQRFEPGTMLIIKRARPMIVPVALDGAYEVYPRGAKWPKLVGRIGVMYGEPIPAESLLEMGPEQAMEHMRRQIERMRLELRKKLFPPPVEYPLPE